MVHVLKLWGAAPPSITLRFLVCKSSSGSSGASFPFYAYQAPS
ncbi:hypothetical protein T07_4675 [Trichinella nelsoni]|uniref:Uncharacterized protein n=1 Tax=Trichinella nelsoni TaxID=6336 RepID=A0A0V0RAK1_9BILA|nr:hypothetical protein T07_4675 [Trichinella nelsoni]